MPLVQVVAGAWPDLDRIRWASAATWQRLRRSRSSTGSSTPPAPRSRRSARGSGLRCISASSAPYAGGDDDYGADQLEVTDSQHREQLAAHLVADCNDLLARRDRSSQVGCQCVGPGCDQGLDPGPRTTVRARPPAFVLPQATWAFASPTEEPVERLTSATKRSQPRTSQPPDDSARSAMALWNLASRCSLPCSAPNHMARVSAPAAARS
jgi:hypothetical protein